MCVCGYVIVWVRACVVMYLEQWNMGKLLRHIFLWSGGENSTWGKWGMRSFGAAGHWSVIGTSPGRRELRARGPVRGVQCRASRDDVLLHDVRQAWRILPQRREMSYRLWRVAVSLHARAIDVLREGWVIAVRVILALVLWGVCCCCLFSFLCMSEQLLVRLTN